MSKMIRVSKANKCPLCLKDSWCLLGSMGDVVLCMRVQSQRPKTLADGTVGWIHMRDGKALPPVRKYEERPAPVLNAALKLASWSRSVLNGSVKDFAVSIGVSSDALFSLGCQPAPYHKTFAFPMRDGNNNIVGIRLRHENGKKWAETGSHQGLFIPQCESKREIILTEGPTDCAAALTIGMYGIGRPTCSGGINDLKLLVKRLKIRRATIIADCDTDRVHKETGAVSNPGISGAHGLSQHLEIPTRIVTLPTKDLRSFVQQGGDYKLFNSIAEQLVWNVAK